MKRAEKIVLITKILKGKFNEGTKQQLCQSNGPGAVVIVNQLGASNPCPNDQVRFYHNGKQVTMPYKDIQAFTRYEPLTICMIPDNGRRKVPESK
ncbi:hypothetical protein [Spirosoma fluviale]|uniref:Uncharacterized protein n=1 Tax=Spirosoma fluviale TaxID=1597977 RepID=A0A286GWB6_9BACT|nr:hypothetical protein [Spirosoma fluviale]SOD99793.1 hypothetical protein SAMN06269250_0170 [Spirosoma fluviale]